MNQLKEFNFSDDIEKLYLYTIFIVELLAQKHSFTMVNTWENTINK